MSTKIIPDLARACKSWAGIPHRSKKRPNGSAADLTLIVNMGTNYVTLTLFPKTASSRLSSRVKFRNSNPSLLQNSTARAFSGRRSLTFAKVNVRAARVTVVAAGPNDQVGMTLPVHIPCRAY